MSQYKLTYFNLRGRAEIIRLVFVAAGVGFEDFRFERQQWSQYKSATPFGQVPVLEFDGNKLCQSRAIARFLARKFNLAGKTEWDEVRADMIVDEVEDMFTAIFKFFFLQDNAAKAEAKSKYLQEQLPVTLDNFERLLKENKGGDGYFVGDGLTWADLQLLVVVDWLQMLGATDLLNERPKLLALSQRIEKLPKIAAWIANRPKTEF